jgi:cystathionine beta-lyase/cystathionine gamma-synthase
MAATNERSFSTSGTSPGPRSASSGFGPQTLAVRGGRRPDSAHGAVLTPICQSTTFAQTGIGEHKGFTYSRCGNPTVAALEDALGACEGARAGHTLAYATGMAALTGLVLGTCRAGDRVVLSRVVYGGTVRLVRELLAPFGLEAVFVDTRDSGPQSELARVLSEPGRPTRLVLVETPANPTLVLTDVAAVARLAHAHGALLAVDNTFLTAVLQPVLPLGADVAVLSTTKYVDGHNATTGGALIVGDHTDELRALPKRLRYVQGILGNAQKPFEAWLTLQGLKTLPLRIAQHSRNALAVARALEAHPALDGVRYPFLESFEQIELARRQQTAGGGIVCFEFGARVAPTPTLRAEAARRLLSSTRLCTLAENLGATETLLTHPATMTHASYTPAERTALGITDGLVRLSVGLEDPEDVVHDLERGIGIALESLASDGLVGASRAAAGVPS